MTANLSIGEFSRAPCLSVKTLRHYQEVGLLEPACIDFSGGYPYYHPNQIATVRIIRRLRDLKMPVKHVKGVLDAPDLRAPTPDRGTPQAHGGAARIHSSSAALELRTLLEEPEGAEAISYRTAPATWALAISAVVTLDELVAWCRAAFDELWDTLASSGTRPAGGRGASTPKTCSNGNKERSSRSSRSLALCPARAALNPSSSRALSSP